MEQTPFQELVTLSATIKRLFAGENFRIKGDAVCFTIQIRNDYYILYLLPVFWVLFIPNLMMAHGDNNFKFWGIIIALTVASGAFLWFYTISKNIIVNTQQKIITQSRSNVFKKPIVKPNSIAFRDIKGFSSKAIPAILGRYGHRMAHRKIYIAYGQQKKHLIDIVVGPQSFKGYATFINCLNSVIKENR
ncbi:MULTISPECIES: hypothetical protein [Flavobacteriaceae]|uniref:hypothetical protein n=1 Tax=Flavobacteriaceae TaxID=49546 RepID=UPI0014924522|nr:MULTISPECIES: hypothetical protein [Allomuricauda]MDC6365356.1 hypothetical protein [Muricauda sp. AC10]